MIWVFLYGIFMGVNLVFVREIAKQRPLEVETPRAIVFCLLGSLLWVWLGLKLTLRSTYRRFEDWLNPRGAAHRRAARKILRNLGR